MTSASVPSERHTLVILPPCRANELNTIVLPLRLEVLKCAMSYKLILHTLYRAADDGLADTLAMRSVNIELLLHLTEFIDLLLVKDGHDDLAFCYGCPCVVLPQ